MVQKNEAASLLQVEANDEEGGSFANSAWKQQQQARRYGLLMGGFVALALVIVAGVAVNGPQRLQSGNAAGVAGLAEKEKESESKCTFGRGNCNETKCCAGPGLQCYEQDKTYAQCRVECIPNAPDITHWNGNKWSCKELGTRTEGKPACGKTGDDCSKSQCCSEPNMQCYVKSEGWATCKEECIPGAPDMTDMDGNPWNCTALGERAPTTADWVQEQCSNGWDDCTKTYCCKNAGEACHKQSDFFGECMVPGTCSKGGWDCGIAGQVTPGAGIKGGMIPDWAKDRCGKVGEACTESKCCLGMDVACYAKNEFWAMCMQGCEAGVHKDDNNSEWTCNQIGPRSYGLATKGFPSLYCFSVYQPDGYEAGLLQAAYDRQAGIFACDEFDLLTPNAQAKIGDVDSVQFEGAEIVTSIDGTAGNTFLFVNAWNAVLGSGKWANHAFTCKVDPDAVFVPAHLRPHAVHYVGANIDFINCHVGNMMYGALEVFSFAAIQQWAARKDECNTPNNYGEDKYMTECMDFLGVQRVFDEGVMGDKLCGTYSNCGDGNNAAYHPFKDLGSYTECMDATGA